MSNIAKAKKLFNLISNPNNIICKTKYIFIFSHMRSRSSVLSHVLGSNPDICGYGELHYSYLNRISLFKLRAELSVDLQCSLKNKYLLDKILHDHTVSFELFEPIKPKVIFLLREPESTIKSIIHMGFMTGIEWYKDPVLAVDYYCSRLLSLKQTAKKVDPDYFFIESNELVDNTETLLNDLTQWLALNEPLNKEYSIFQKTGRRSFGDSSENIQLGVLKRTKGYADIVVPNDLLHKAEDAYIDCKQMLLTSNIKPTALSV